jgi:aspartokinase/homoserine dehydrogenase 1
MGDGWVVHKFGGTSLADAAAYRRVGEILRAEDPQRDLAVVVSAMAGTTDALIRLVELAGARDEACHIELEALRGRHVAVAEELLGPGRGKDELARIQEDFQDIRDLLRAVWLMRARPVHTIDLVSGMGELWSARLLAAHLSTRDPEVACLDARDVLIVRRGEISPAVDWERSRTLLERWRADHPARRMVITGFVASDPAGVPTTLGRNGSDFSASIFASLLGAASITIWTDVDGVLSADPRRVTDAHVLDELSYDEAMELAYFGAKVLHPSTMAPAVATGIPIHIRNTFRPEARGTTIHAATTRAFPVKGLSIVERMALVNLEGSGMIGVPGIAERLFGALRQAGVSVVLISQGSSEHSICFAVPEVQSDAARAAVDRAFADERQQYQVRSPEVTPDCAILALVGDGMAGTPGLAGKFFGALGRAGINVRAIAQGSSERNISVVIDGRDGTRALRAVHAGFYLSNQTLSIGLVGPGTVGATLLDQFSGQIARLREELRIDLRVRAIAGRERMLLDDREIPCSRWRAELAARAVPLDLDRLVDHVQTDCVPHAVLIDCTADSAIAARYAEWLERGLHVITPNKKANTGDLSYSRRLRASGRKTRTHYLYEATVGAGLPVIQTLRDLIRTGDEILGIEGVLSGTLSYLFNSFDGTRPFSELVREARARGYTEPDPREDLSGTDVARKLVILAREMDLELGLEDVELEGLVPFDAGSMTVDSFLDRLREDDERMAALVAETSSRGEVLRFVGVVDPAGRSSVRLRGYPRSHAFARIALTDNIVQFRTRRYHDNPLIVQGPGAGPEVTAGGVFADLLRLAAYLGASL